MRSSMLRRAWTLGKELSLVTKKRFLPLIVAVFIAGEGITLNTIVNMYTGKQEAAMLLSMYEAELTSTALES